MSDIKTHPLDTADVKLSVSMLDKQVEHVMQDSSQLHFSDDKKNAVREVIISGMGGSLFSYYVIKSLLGTVLSVPLTFNNDYQIPDRVGPQTLWIASSYSGETEETVSATRQAIAKNAWCIGVTTGGTLAQELKKHGADCYTFTPTYNPSGQPRVALGYMIFSVLFILEKCGLTPHVSSTVTQALQQLTVNHESCKTMALDLSKKVPDTQLLFVAGEHLAGNAHIARNQINETSKTYAEYHLVPELNHHLMEGMKYPESKRLTWIFMESALYNPRITERIKLTKDVLDKQGIAYESVDARGHTTVQDVLLQMQITSYLSLYLGLAKGEDPSLIPWVTYFKKNLT